MFKSDRLLFMGISIRRTDVLRDMVSDFGIVPMPMYDEEQENYVSYNIGLTYSAIPISAKNPLKCAVLLEALNAESHKSVIPAYYKTALKGKYSRDADTLRMLDLILETAYIDFTLINQASTAAINTWAFNQITSKNENIMSSRESQRTKFETALENLLNTQSK